MVICVDLTQLHLYYSEYSPQAHDDPPHSIQKLCVHICECAMNNRCKWNVYMLKIYYWWIMLISLQIYSISLFNMFIVFYVHYFHIHHIVLSSNQPQDFDTTVFPCSIEIKPVAWNLKMSVVPWLLSGLMYLK
jgi:hypothetical protein